MVIQNRKNIPKGWKKRALQQCVDIDLHSLSEKTADNKNFFYIDLSAVSNGHIMFPKAKVCFKDAPSRARRIIHKGDIIFSTVRPYLKGFALVGFDSNDYIVSTGFSVLTAKNNFSSKYIYHYLFSENFQKQIFISLSGSSFPALNSKEVKGLSILIPISIAEQQKIVEVLETWDKAIQLTRKLIEQKELQKKYLMQRLLTGRTRLKRFTKRWKTIKLGDICKIYQPKTLSVSQLTSTGFPVFGANGPIGFYTKYNHQTWQILITCRGATCGTVNRTFGPAWITGNAMVINADNSFKIEKLFLFYLLMNKNFTPLISGSGQPQIVRGPLENLAIIIPVQIAEQTMISSILQKADQEIDLLRQKLSKLEEQKKGLMQVLLTGKIRLKI